MPQWVKPILLVRDKPLGAPASVKRVLNCIHLYLLLHLFDHKEILHIPRQHSCLGMCKISLWLDQFSLNTSEDKFHQIPNSIELSSAGWMLGLWRQLTFNTMRPRQNGRHFSDDIFKCVFLNEKLWIAIRISLKFVPKDPINNIPALVQIMAWRRLGDKPLSEPVMFSLLTHICITRPQWVRYIVCLFEKNTHLSLFEWSYSSIRTPQHHKILIKKKTYRYQTGREFAWTCDL